MTFASSENAALRARLHELERERDAEREWAKGVGDCVVAAVKRAERAEARVAEMEAVLGEACDVAIWMSGSTDFSPGGIAHEGWEKARPRLHAAMRALSSTRGGGADD